MSPLEQLVVFGIAISIGMAIGILFISWVLHQMVLIIVERIRKGKDKW